MLGLRWRGYNLELAFIDSHAWSQKITMAMNRLSVITMLGFTLAIRLRPWVSCQRPLCLILKWPITSGLEARLKKSWSMTYREFALFQALTLFYRLMEGFAVTDLFQTKIPRLLNLRVPNKSTLCKFYRNFTVISEVWISSTEVGSFINRVRDQVIQDQFLLWVFGQIVQLQRAWSQIRDQVVRDSFSTKVRD